MGYNKLNIKLAGLTLAMLLTGCSDDFLKPDPLSMYEPGATFSTVSGLEAAMAVSDRHLRIIMLDGNDNNMPISTELQFSEMGLWGKTDANGDQMQDNLAYKITPRSGLHSGGDANHILRFWNEGWNGIKYANTVINNVDNVVGLDENTVNQYKGRAYFHRAMRYYTMVFQFGDIPLVTKLPTTPKQNYRSCKKEAILEMLVKDLEFAVEWVPSQRDMPYYGSVNKEACRMLLAKMYLATGQYAKAEQQCDELINNSDLELMREPFGDFITANDETWPITRNVIWDLHRPENKIREANRELIMGIVNRTSITSSFTRATWQRIFVPFWNGPIMLPDGVGGTAVDRPSRKSGAYDITNDWVQVAGRGIATSRATYYAQHGMWTVNGVEDKDDLRHNSRVGNWINMEDIRYNNKKSSWHGKGLQLYAPEDVFGDDGKLRIAKGQLLCSDTIRCWHDFPYYKLYYVDHTAKDNLNDNAFYGPTGHADDNANMYLFRLAEAYLVRAEAKLYQGKATLAADDLNELRRRAKCSQYYSGAVNIGDIADERGRELWFEEWRNVELTRISMCLANTGIPDEWGNVYDKNTWDKQAGTDKEGGSYWYQRIMHHSIYNRGYTFKSGNGTMNYTIDKRNLFWPIPYSAAIEANTQGQLQQNYGYDGYDPSIPMWETWEEAVADEG